jgi:TonB family protein
MKNSLITLLLLHLVLSGFSQVISYDVRGAYIRPILKEKLQDAKTLRDINPDFPSSWITGYIAAEILVTSNGTTLKAVSANDTLSADQKSILKTADSGAEVVINVKYRPKNASMDAADSRLINFSYTVIPEVEATYPGGHEVLKQYLKESAIDKIAEPIARQLQLATVRFTINEEGLATDVQIAKTSDDDILDNLLLEAIMNMPKWVPAKNSSGIAVKQEFEFSVGNFVGC